MKIPSQIGTLVVLLATVTQSATYWVSPAGARSWANALSQSPLTGTAAASMAIANANASAGDTVFLRNGTYGTGVAPAKSGTASGRITFKGYPGETVKIMRAATGINTAARAYISIEAITTDSCGVFADLRNSNHIQITACTLKNSSAATGWPVGILMYTNSQYNRIANCIIGNSGFMTANDDIGGLINIGNWADSLDQTSHNLIEGNELYHGGHHILELAAKYTILRNNTFHNENWTVCPRSATGNLCGNRDAIIADDYLDSYWNVFDGNRIAFSGASIDDATGGSGISIRGTHTIMRRNLVYRCDGPGISFYADRSGTYDPRYSRIYHNVVYKNGVSPLSATDFRYTFGLLFDCVAGTTPAIPITDEVIKNNLFYRNIGGDLYYYYTNPALQTVTGNYYASASNNSKAMVAIAGNTLSTADPLFAGIPAQETVAAIDAFDFHLQPTSPAIDKGDFLTVTAAAGTGTVMTVSDASYFIDGYGLVGGDTIQLQGQVEPVHIVGVDYSANKLTLDKPLTWTAGQGVTLAYSGAAPDIGAFEYSSSAGALRPKTTPKVLHRVGRRADVLDFAGLVDRPGHKIEVRIYSASGKQVMIHSDGSRYQINLTASGFAKGIYFYAVTLHSGNIAAGKFALYQ
jgi:hypothetical protein